jgi:anthranilate synthase component 1
MLVKVDSSGTIFTHPIAGTRRRGATPEEDEAIAAELLADPKERAEHIMLVDLGRNDIGRVASPGSVRVDSLMHIEKYSHVMHIVSNVSGKLAPSKTPYDAFRSVFPAGTVSGAPKIKAVELVARLEPHRRGVYAGAVGYVGFTGVLDTAIAIRTLVVRGREVHLQAGAGIVYDSVPVAEYEETISKLRATMRAVDAAVAAGEAQTDRRRERVSGDVVARPAGSAHAAAAAALSGGAHSGGGGGDGGHSSGGGTAVLPSPLSP